MLSSLMMSSVTERHHFETRTPGLVEENQMERKPVRVEAKASRSWVVEIQQLLGDTDAGVEKEKDRWDRQCIYRVPEWLRKATDRSAYMPMVVSLGPFHHGHHDLLPMEAHKRRAMLHLVKRSGKPLQDFVAAVAEVAEELMDAYKDLRAEKSWRGENSEQRFVEMMVIDGCFLVEVMRWKDNFRNGRKEEDYASNDPVFSERGNQYAWPSIYRDIILIENQLPLLLILKIQDLLDPTKHQNLGDISRAILELLGRPNEFHINQRGLHPLSILRSTYIPFTSESTEDNPSVAEMKWPDDNTFSAEKMREAGIHFEKSHTDGILGIDYDERSGVLSMPYLKFYTPMMLLNMMAFELLHPNTQNDVTAYVFFIDDIIDTAKDVELLKSKGIISSEMGTDKDVAKLFNNTLNRSIVMSKSSNLHRVREQVYAHCKKRRNRWQVSLIDTYFSNPWKFISLVAAVILLVATLVQTVCAVLQSQNT